MWRCRAGPSIEARGFLPAEGRRALPSSPGGGGVLTPPEAGEVEVAGAGSRRVLGCSDCSTPSGGVFLCFWKLSALSAGDSGVGAREGLRDAAEPGVLGEPGGSPVEMPLLPL